MQEFIFTGLLGALLIITCCFVVYETLRFIWARLPRMKSHPRMRILLLVCGIFGSHIVNIWLFGAVYYALLQLGYGSFTGTDIERGIYSLDIFGCVYFSAVTYTTLGIGDITPEGAMRMLTGVQSLTGFLLIGWTVTFTYLAMEKFWELPHRRRK